MRMIVTADWHIRNTRPRCRVDDDWMGTQRKALDQIADAAVKHNCPVYCVGDIFHSNSDTNFECMTIVQDFSNKLASHGLVLGVLAGNHDLPYHNSDNIGRSAIGVLLQSYNIWYILDSVHDELQENISASNFDESDNRDAKFVFKHILCFPDVKSLPPNVDAVTAKDLLSMFPKARWIFTGDYHHNFHYEKNGRHVVNPGCILRQASDMKDYQCGVYYVDTDENKVEFIPIKDDDNFVDDSYIVKEKEKIARIEEFADSVTNVKKVSLDFLDNVEQSLLQQNFDDDLKDVIKELCNV